MNRKLIIFILMLIALIYLLPWLYRPGWAYGVTYTINGPEDFGGTFSGAYDTILFDLPGDTITCDSGIFTSSGANSIIDFDDDTVYYHGTQNTNNGSRIALLVQGNYSTVLNIKIQAYQASTDSGGIGLNIGGSTGIVVDSTTGVPSFVHAAGKDANSVYCDGAAKLMLRGFNATHFGTKFTDRSYQRGYAIWLNDYSVGTYNFDSSYGYWVEDIVIDSAPHGGIAIVGNGDRLVMKHITGRLDCRNDEYDTLTSDADTKGVANSFFLGVDNYGENAWISACSLFNTGTVYQGARGVSFNDDGPAGYHDGGSKGLIMEYCYFKGSSGYDDYFKWGYVGHMIQSEEPNNGLVIRNCYFEGSVAATGAVTSYKGNRHCVVYFGHSCNDSTQFYNNRVICNGADGLYYGSALGLDQSGAGYVNSYNNYYEAPVPVIRFGAVPDGGRDASGDCAFDADTVNRSAAYSDSANGDGDIAWISTGNASINNGFTDMAYTGNDTTVSIQATSLTKEATFHRTLPLVVLGVDGYPVSGARVRLWNAYSVLVGVDTTGTGGTVDNIIPAILYKHYGLTDSTYNNFAASAIVGSDSTTLTGIAIGLVSGQDTLTMSATAGYVTISAASLISTGWTMADDPDLSIPRNKVMAFLQKLWVCMAQDANDPAIVYSADSGSTWNTIDFRWDTLGGTLHDHAAFAGDSSSGIHMACPEDLSALGLSWGVTYRNFPADGTQASDRGAARVVCSGYPSTGPRVGIAASADTVWVAVRSTVSGSFDTTRVYFSANLGTTWDSAIYDAQASTGTAAHRIALDMDNSGFPDLWRLKYQVGITHYNWDGPTNGMVGSLDSLFVNDNGLDPTFERSFDVVCANTHWHAVYGRDDGATDRLIHATDYSGSVVLDTISTMTYTSLSAYPTLFGYNGRVYCVWHLNDVGTDGNFGLKGWDSVNGWWNDSLVIGYGHQFTQAPYSTPTDLGVAVIAWVNSNDSLMNTILTFDAPAPAAAATRYVIKGWKR